MEISLLFGNVSTFINFEVAVSKLLPPIALSEHMQYMGNQESGMSFWKPRSLTPMQFPEVLYLVTEEALVQSILAVMQPLLLPSCATRCRQFVEMVNGTDSEVRCFSARSPRSQDSYPGSPCLSPRHGSNNSHVHSTGKCVLCVS